MTLLSLRQSLQLIALLALSLLATKMQAQTADLGVSMVAAHSLRTGPQQNFWLEGGSIELGLQAWKGLGIAANVTGLHSGSIGGTGIPISLVTATFGPRYRLHLGHTLSLYGEGLIGEANGFDGSFPTPHGVQNSANSFAVQAGGGVDIKVNKHLAVRALQVNWLRTQLPNAADNVQNHLQLGAGLVFLMH